MGGALLREPDEPLTEVVNGVRSASRSRRALPRCPSSLARRACGLEVGPILGKHQRRAGDVGRAARPHLTDRSYRPFSMTRLRLARQATSEAMVLLIIGSISFIRPRALTWRLKCTLVFPGPASARR
jgi:hypothetical protein